MQDQKSPYELLGGEARVRELVDRFYDYMDTLEEAGEIRAMHAKSLRASREKLFLFLSGWLGGPDLYVQKYGHPRLRQRHMPFPVDKAARDQWLLCMHKALLDMQLDEGLHNYLEQSFWRTADFMRNQSEHGESDDRLPIFTGPAPGKS